MYGSLGCECAYVWLTLKSLPVLVTAFSALFIILFFTFLTSGLEKGLGAKGAALEL